MIGWLLKLSLIAIVIQASISLPLVINETALPGTGSNFTEDGEDIVSSAYRKDYVFELAGDERDSEADEPSEEEDTASLIGRKQYEDGDEESEDKTMSEDFQNGLSDGGDEAEVDLSRPEQERDNIANSRESMQQQDSYQDSQLTDRSMPYDSRDILQQGDGSMRNDGGPIEQFDGSPGLRPGGEFVGLRSRSPFMEEGFFDSFYNRNPNRENIPRSPRIIDEGGNPEADSDLRSNYNNPIVYEDDGDDEDEDYRGNSMVERTLGRKRMSDYDEIIVDRGEDGREMKKKK